MKWYLITHVKYNLPFKLKLIHLQFPKGLSCFGCNLNVKQIWSLSIFIIVMMHLFSSSLLMVFIHFYYRRICDAERNLKEKTRLMPKTVLSPRLRLCFSNPTWMTYTGRHTTERSLHDWEHKESPLFYSSLTWWMIHRWNHLFLKVPVGHLGHFSLDTKFSPSLSSLDSTGWTQYGHKISLRSTSTVCEISKTHLSDHISDNIL